MDFKTLRPYPTEIPLRYSSKHRADPYRLQELILRGHLGRLQRPQAQRAASGRAIRRRQENRTRKRNVGAASSASIISGPPTFFPLMNLPLGGAFSPRPDAA